jgi:tetratricopeptide (TPR) repeat protein
MQDKKHDIPEVIAVRNWKEYLGESLLIIFSVSLAIGLTEMFTAFHENQQTKEVLHQLKEELTENKKSEEDQFQYHLKILKRIDSALKHPEYALQFINNGEVHISVIIDSGVLRHDLNDVSWQIAKQNNVFTKLDLPTYSLLTDIYANQQKIAKAEDEIGKLLLSWESRKPENIKTTLILIHDTYYGWAVERAPRLLEKYKKAIDKLSSY